MKLLQALAMSIGTFGVIFLGIFIAGFILTAIHSAIVAFLLKTPPGEEPYYKDLDDANANAIGIMIMGGLFIFVTYCFYISE